MKNKLFYLIGVAFLMCSISMFTSCSTTEEDPIIEDVDGKDDPEEEDVLDLNGKYSEADDYALKMTYNGEPLTGKRVTFLADESNETATIELSGIEKDLTELIGGLMEFKIPTSSPIPGIKEIILNDVELTPFKKGAAFMFEGEFIQPTYTMGYTGTVEEGEMVLKITNKLVNQEMKIRLLSSM